MGNPGSCVASQALISVLQGLPFLSSLPDSSSLGCFKACNSFE